MRPSTCYKVENGKHTHFFVLQTNQGAWVQIRAINLFSKAAKVSVQILHGYPFDSYHNLFRGDFYTKAT